MQTLLTSLLLTTALLFSALFGADGIYVGLFADTKTLSAFPFGTEQGWRYHDKTTYMISGIIYTLFSWLPLLVYLFVQRLNPRQ